MIMTATVRVCLEPALQDRAGGVFHRLGLNLVFRQDADGMFARLGI